MRLSDTAQIKALLESDRGWSVYALGDLAPGFAEHSEWHHTPGPDPALLLFYRAPAVPVLFTLGPPEQVRALLADLPPEPKLYLSIRPEILPVIALYYRVDPQAGCPMWRMLLQPADFRPAETTGVARLGWDDLPALQALHADGAAPSGGQSEAPDFFEDAMLARGVYYGVREGQALVAAAGTHLVTPETGVAAIGNVYTRRDRRGRGLAARVTSAVAAELLCCDPPLATIALNVSQSNPAALRVYERLGFRRYCAFLEGVAERRPKAEDG